MESSIRYYFETAYRDIIRVERQLVEHGDLLSERKLVQKGWSGRVSPKRNGPDRLLISRSEVRVPHHPHM